MKSPATVVVLPTPLQVTLPVAGQRPAGATLAANPVPTQTAGAAPSPLPTEVATVVPTVAAEDPQPITAESAWQPVLRELDDTWGTDTAATVNILEAFHSRFPEYQPATDKLYAALIAAGDDLVEEGAIDAGADQLTRAAELLPDRPEAPAELQALIQ